MQDVFGVFTALKHGLGGGKRPEIGEIRHCVTDIQRDLQREVLLEDCRRDERPDVLHPTIIELGEGIPDSDSHFRRH